MTSLNNFRLPAVLTDAAELVRRLAPHDRGRADVKADGSPVTRVDIEVDAFLKQELGGLMPEAGWLSEETVDDPAPFSCEWIWVVDPLDGTREFLQRVPACAVSIALVRYGTPVAAGVINPFTHEWDVIEPDRPPVFHGLTARPAPAALTESVATVSRTEMRDRVLESCRPFVCDLRPVGSAAYKLLRVVAGADHLTFSPRSKSEWDICAGVALLRAAGPDDARIRTGAAACTTPLVREFLQVAAEAGTGARTI